MAIFENKALADFEDTALWCFRHDSPLSISHRITQSGQGTAQPRVMLMARCTQTHTYTFYMRHTTYKQKEGGL